MIKLIINRIVHPSHCWTLLFWCMKHYSWNSSWKRYNKINASFLFKKKQEINWLGKVQNCITSYNFATKIDCIVSCISFSKAHSADTSKTKVIYFIKDFISRVTKVFLVIIYFLMLANVYSKIIYSLKVFMEKANCKQINLLSSSYSLHVKDSNKYISQSQFPRLPWNSEKRG